jgi:hypothetical protein
MRHYFPPVRIIKKERKKEQREGKRERRREGKKGRKKERERKKDVRKEKLEPLIIVGRNIKGCSCHGKQCGSVSKIKTRTPIRHSNPTFRYVFTK